MTLISAQVLFDVVHQGVFGALAAWGFGVLFNFDWRSLIWCSALGALALGVRTLALAGGIGQSIRAMLHARRTNPCLIAAAVAFIAGVIGGFGAHAAGSGSAETALIASTLLLVPGVPATNAQTDIMEGFPTVGSARAVSVAMIMVFATIGICGAEAVLGMLT